MGSATESRRWSQAGDQRRLSDAEIADFEEFYRRNINSLIGFMVRAGAEPHEAADVAQLAMTQAFEHWHSVTHHKPWVFQVAARAFARSRSVRRTQPLSDETLEQLTTAAASAESIVEAGEDAREYLTKLTTRQREVLQLRAEGFPTETIARILGMSASTVRVHLAQARQRYNEADEARSGGAVSADRRAKRREQLMAAGLQLFGTDGYANSSIDKLCTHAGVPTRNFYEEFHSREDLLIALHSRANERAYRAVTAAFAQTTNTNTNLVERLEVSVSTFINSMAADPRRARVVFVEMYGVSSKVEKHRLEWRKRWQDFIIAEANRAAPPGAAQSRDFTMPALAVIASINELVFYYSANRERLALDEIIQEVVRFTVAALTT